MNRQRFLFLVLNILLVIFLTSIPFLSFHGPSFVGKVLPVPSGPFLLGAFLFGMFWMTVIFVATASIGVFVLYKLGKSFISDHRCRRFYFLTYFAVFFLLPCIFLCLTTFVDSKITKQQRVNQQKYRGSIQFVNISERLVQGSSCLDKNLTLEMDVDVKYTGDYYFGGRLELDENLPAKTGRLETRIANGINTWPYCDEDQRDEQSKCRSLLYLESGLNHITVEFPDFGKRLIEIKGVGSFPLRNYWTTVIHRRRSFIERWFDIIMSFIGFSSGGAIIAQGKISVETYYAGSEIKPEYKTNYYDYQEIKEQCL